jgi:hypothetical protein
LEKFQPQVQILSPKPDETLTDDQVTVKLAVADLPLFKQPELGLGNHLHVILDQQTYQGVYDLSQPLVFKNLAAGTHSLRVFASRPWHESFKNEGAYAQVSFNVLTKTAENNPDPQKPLLTYSRPTGTYGAEPIMLDYYLTNAPSHLVANGSQDSLPDWRIRVTVNDQRFILDQWAPVYLQGFKQGKNWVRLELVDDRGNPMPNVYNDSVSIVTYDPQTKDTLAKLVRGEIDPQLADALVDPNYVAITPTPTSTPIPVHIPVPLSTPDSIPATIPAPIILPTPSVTAPPPIITSSPSPVVIAPVPISKPSPNLIVTTPSIPPSEAVKTIVEPPITPSPPIPGPVISNPPSTIPVAKAVPRETPIPETIKTPVVPTPQPIPAPTPELAPVPTVIPNIVVENNPVVDHPVTAPSAQPLPPQTKQLTKPTPSGRAEPDPIPSPEITSVAPAASIQPQDEKTWQTQANELRRAAGVKIRAFTNTIPSKAQRFGHNVQIWVSNAINQIQAWQASHVD